ncbi:MAG: hypothetical protein ACLUOI_39970 [Eisenbergiella sp.]
MEKHFYPVQEIEDIFVCTRRYLETCVRVSFPGKPSAGFDFPCDADAS